MIKRCFRRIGRWFKYSWKEILSWIITIIGAFAIFAMGFGVCFILVRDEVLYLERMTTAAEPEVCAFCRNGEGAKIHAPCIINLSTGEIAELSVYEPHPSEIGEVTSELKKGYFSIYSDAGANIVRKQENELCEATLPKDREMIDPGHFCYECRRILSDIDREGYIIADLYNPTDAKAYKVWDGAKYEIRDYLVTVNKNENKSLEVEVHGLLEQEN